MATFSKYVLVNRAARGKIMRQIAKRRERGESYADIALWIGQRYEIRVTGEAVRQWSSNGKSHAA